MQLSAASGLATDPCGWDGVIHLVWSMAAQQESPRGFEGPLRCDFDSSHSQREEEGGRRSASAAALSFMNRKPDPYGRDATPPYRIPLEGWWQRGAFVADHVQLDLMVHNGR